MSDNASQTSRINQRILGASVYPFMVSVAAIVAMLVIFVYTTHSTDIPIQMRFSSTDSAPVRFLILNSIYLTLFLIALFSTYIGYRLTFAAGATRAIVIPPEDYELVSDLIKNANAEGIDLYVRISSLSKSIGTFTQLGLTGLPLATIGLTVFFSLIAIFQRDFLDIAKLTLGAFIGSFVQRQVERRGDPRNDKKEHSTDLKDLAQGRE